jgi:SulP family sulfate permease
MQYHNVLTLDLTDVPLLGVTTSLAFENAIEDAVEQDRDVFIVGATAKMRQRLERLGILKLIPLQNLPLDCLEVLEQVVALVTGLERTATKHRPDDSTASMGYLTT